MVAGDEQSVVARPAAVAHEPVAGEQQDGDVDEQHREHVVIARGLLYRVLQAGVEQQPVRQVGEPVILRQMPKSFSRNATRSAVCDTRQRSNWGIVNSNNVS